jgi:hypothetical protein
MEYDSVRTVQVGFWLSSDCPPKNCETDQLAFSACETIV